MEEAIDVEAAQATFPAIMRRVQRGEEVLLSRDGQPVAKIVPVVDAAPNNRRLGALAGQIPAFTDEEWRESDRQVRELFSSSATE